MRQAAAICRNDIRIVRNDPVFVISMVVMPLIVMGFISPAFDHLYVDGTNGATHAVPAVTVMFAFLLIGNVGFNIYREHGWNTWKRLRASSCTPSQVVAGKLLLPLMLQLVQLALLLGLGAYLFDLRILGGLPELALVASALALCLVAMGAALMALATTILQVNAVSNLASMLLAGLGGAIAPFEALPAWAQAAAPSTPSYWAMRGFTNVINGAPTAEVLISVGVLVAYAVLFAGVAVRGFRYDARKTFA